MNTTTEDPLLVKEKQETSQEHSHTGTVINFNDIFKFAFDLGFKVVVSYVSQSFDRHSILFQYFVQRGKKIISWSFLCSSKSNQIQKFCLLDKNRVVIVSRL